jgi:hypothetical protein
MTVRLDFHPPLPKDVSPGDAALLSITIFWKNNPYLTSYISRVHPKDDHNRISDLILMTFLLT